MSLLASVARELRPVVQDAIGRGCWELATTGRRNGHHVRLVHTSGRAVPITNTRVGSKRIVMHLRTDLLRIERAAKLTGSS